MGLPISSGEVESAHRYIPQKRYTVFRLCWRLMHDVTQESPFVELALPCLQLEHTCYK